MSELSEENASAIGDSNSDFGKGDFLFSISLACNVPMPSMIREKVCRSRYSYMTGPRPIGAGTFHRYPLSLAASAHAPP